MFGVGRLGLSIARLEMERPMREVPNVARFGTFAGMPDSNIQQCQWNVVYWMVSSRLHSLKVLCTDNLLRSDDI